MKRLASILVAALLAASAAPHVTAATEGARPAGREKPSLDQQELYRGSRIIGAAVHDSRDRKIGEVKDLLLDSARGEVAYAILGFGGRKLHPVPWRALQPGESGRNYVLDADREVIAQAPGFDMGEWPETSDQRWSEDIDRYWNRMVGRGPAAGPQAAGTASGTSGGAPASGASGTSGSGAGKQGAGNVGRAERR